MSSPTLGHYQLIVVEGLLTVMAVVRICGCQNADVNQLEKEGVHPITDIFDFRKEMRLAYIEMCKQEAQRDHGDYEGWA